MCGIVGGTHPEWAYEAAVERLRHRGPDSQRTVRVGGLTLGFTRLAIIDRRELADQPMAAADGQVWLVFNGEIYGFQALRRELEKAGHGFRTLSDTEVFLRAYLEWGDAFVDRLDGMFAAAIYDRRVEQLKLLRDRPGIKPLYYSWDGTELAFASELKGIEALHRGRLTVDPTAVYDFLTYRYIPDPKTLYKGVFKLPPASRLVFDLRRRRLASPERYWELPVAAGGGDVGIEEACRQLRGAIEESVSEQLVADVPLGFFLSGGMDSSVVVAAASRSENELQTFSIGFEVPQHTETHFAKEVAERFATVHHEETLTLESMTELFGSMKIWYDEPFADNSAVPTYLVSRFARERVTVALSGDGGDEVFGGYRWYERYRRFRRLGFGWVGDLSGGLERARRWLPAGPLQRVLNLAVLAASDELSFYVQLMGGMTRGEKRRYAARLGIEPEYDDCWFFRKFWRPELPLMTRLQYLDFHTYLPGDILTKVDRASMANSLEVRVPLLSRRLVELAFSLPEEQRLCGGELKGLLKRAYRGVLPASILERGKKGFSVPPEYLPAGGWRRFQERILAEHYGIRP